MKEILLESWDRQARIMNSLMDLINEDNRKVKPSEDGWPLDFQLAHIHNVRDEWLSSIAPEYGKKLGPTYVQRDGNWFPLDDLEEIKAQCRLSAQLIGEAMSELLDSGAGRIHPYDHPIFFLQHMVWHEGWHAGLITLALRLNGQEPSDEWGERHMWGVWRDPEI
jgi:uncharacterized damage-inducible protein DinB